MKKEKLSTSKYDDASTKIQIPYNTKSFFFYWVDQYNKTYFMDELTGMGEITFCEFIDFRIFSRLKGFISQIY